MITDHDDDKPDAPPSLWQALWLQQRLPQPAIRHVLLRQQKLQAASKVMPAELLRPEAV
jgi:hypothetical protein